MSSAKSKRTRRKGFAWAQFSPYLLAVVFFYTLCLCSAATVKVCCMILILLTVFAVILRFRLMQERISYPLLAVLLVVVMGGISTLYAISGKFALFEFLKMLCGACMALLVLALIPARESRPSRWVALILSGATALAGLVSIDLLSTRLFSGLVLGIIGLVSSDYQDLAGIEPGVRMLSIFMNPNVFAGCTGIGTLLSLGLSVQEQTEKERNVSLCLLFVNAISFLLAFSMGASAMFVLGFAVFFLVERKERRGKLLIVSMETLLLAMPAVVPVYLTAFQGWNGFQPVPLLAAVGGAALLCVLDRFVGVKLSTRLERLGKLWPLVLLGLAVLLGLFLAAAMNLTGPGSVSAPSPLRRAAYPAPGSYTLSVAADGEVTLTIESQNQQDTMMQTSTLIYEGPADRAEFTVPEDSIVCYFNFFAAEETQISSASYSGSGGSGRIPLGYYLLPGFIANRLQGIRANQNAIQRVVFFSDGLKLFTLSPVFGRGLGGFENGIKSIQSFYYETKYAHNHYIQALCDMGIVGLILFLTMLAVTAIGLWRARRREDFDPLCPVLAGCLVFMAGHAAVEVIFSAYPFIPLAYCVIALAGFCCREAMPLPQGMPRKLPLLGFGGLTLAFAVLLGGNISAQQMLSSRTVTLPLLQEAIGLDRYEWADYMLSYVNAIAQEPSHTEYLAQADEYAERLSRLDSNTVPYYLTIYYLNTGRADKAIAMAEKYVSYVASDASGWQRIFELLMSAAPQYWEEPAFRQGILALWGELEDWNAKNMGSITLSEDVINMIEGARNG